MSTDRTMLAVSALDGRAALKGRTLLMMTRILLALALFAFASSAFAEALTDQKRADIDRLMQMTGARAIGQQMSTAMVGQMTQMLRQARPDIPQEVLDVLPEEVNAVISESMDDFINAVIPVYHKYFTASEIKEMIAFYGTPLGQKTIRVMPALVGESMQLGQQWGESMGPLIEQRIRARCKKEGYAI
jgi:uncharacterized protein